MLPGVVLVRLEQVLESKGIDAKQFATMMSYKLHIATRYINRYKCSMERTKDIAKKLDVSVEYLLGTEKQEKKAKIIYDTPCKNQSCPLNKDCICVNDTVISGKAPCFGKHKVTSKRRKRRFEVFY